MIAITHVAGACTCMLPASLGFTSDPIICFGLLPCETCLKRSVRAKVFRPLITVTHTL